jgi:hypothetical protein
MTGQQRTDDRSWALAPALAAERDARTRRVGVGSLVLVAGGLAVGAAVAVGLDRAGAGPPAVLALVAFPSVAAIVARSRRARISAPLEAGVLLANWLRVEGLVDETGRLVAGHAVGAGETTPDTPAGERAIALEAYRMAAEYQAAGRDDWLEPFVAAARLIDLREVRTALLEHTMRRMPAIGWVVIVPLALIGAALVVCSLAIGLAYALGLRV